jgi:hypothetical protein
MVYHNIDLEIAPNTGDEDLELGIPPMFVNIARLTVMVGLLAAAGCTYRPGADHPVARSLQWFSYAGAADIRDACQAGSADRIRLIYNGKYDEQLRSYDVVALGAGAPGDGATVEVRIRGPKVVSKAFELFDLFAPWRAEGRLLRIDAAQFGALRRALEDSGLARPVPGGIRLNSLEFYWLVSACLDGRFTMNAWKYPSERFEALGFPKVLLRLDPAGPELNPPRPYNEFATDQDTDRFIDFGFDFKVEGNRLIGS